MEITDSLFLSLNFEGTEIPKRVELVPAGSVVSGRDGRTWKNKNPKQVALNSMARLPKLPIDENHATDLAAPKGGASPALGWMTNLCADESGAISADVEWTPRGAQAVSNKEYGFLSPVFLADSAGEIHCVLRAALTNSPNLGLPALNAEQKNNDMEDNSMKKELCAALGLPETATDAEVLAAVGTAAAAQKEKALNAESGGKSGLQVDLQVYAPRAELNAAKERAAAAENRLAELNAAALKREAEGEVDAAVKAGKITPGCKNFYVELCATREGLEKFKVLAAEMPAIVDGRVQAPDKPPPAAGVSLNSEDTAFAAAAGYSAESWAKIKEAGK